jgi:tetratricopeptide (TPR) repeat protein
MAILDRNLVSRYITMRLSLLLCGLLLALPTFSQTSVPRINGTSEPPELTGEPKKVTEPSEADSELFEIIGHLKNEEEMKSTLPKLDEFIKRHPDYSDALFLRATCTACILNSRDFTAIQNDVEAAMSHSGQVYNNTDYYSLLGKIEFAKANYVQAMDYLERAMARDLDTANRMFNIEGVEPEKTSKFCIWNLTDLDGLVARFPKDYRAWLFRGLYYEFFTTFKEDYYPLAMQNFQRAALLNPASPLPQYLIGQLYSKASFWTKKAWASDQARNEQIRNAAQAYTKAIQLDPKFLPAYEHRASDYLNLKQYQQALPWSQIQDQNGAVQKSCRTMKPIFTQLDDPGHRGLHGFEEAHSVRSGCLRWICVYVSVPLEHGEKLQGKCLILTVSALAAVFLECAHHENVDEVQRLFGHFIESVAFDEEHVFVSEVHMEIKRESLFLKKGRWRVGQRLVVRCYVSLAFTCP